MPQRKEPTEEFVFENSQSSDDPSLELALINHYKAAQERKHREKQVKFAQAAENKLTEEITTIAEGVVNCMKNLEKLYNIFILEYAVSEDRIRALWKKIHSLDEEYNAVLEDIQKDQVAQEGKTEEKQVAGLAKVRKACEDYTITVQQLS